MRLRDPRYGSQVRVLRHTDNVHAVCAVQAGDRTLLATSSYDGTVRLWDPGDGSQVSALTGHTGPVYAVCTVQAGDHTLLATGSDDKTVRLWDPADATCVLTVPVHHAVRGMTQVADSLAIGLEAGVLVIKFEADTFT